MPPKAKYTKGQVIDFALNIVRREGLKGLTARTLAKEMNCSTRPIFTVYENMEEIEDDVISRMSEIYNQYVLAGLSEDLAFKGVGIQYIQFAKKEPILFQQLFMTERQEMIEIEYALTKVESNFEVILMSIVNEYQVSKEVAKSLYNHLWIYTHGIASLIATGMCVFEDSKVESMMTDVFRGALINEKRKQSDSN